MNRILCIGLLLAPLLLPAQQPGNSSSEPDFRSVAHDALGSRQGSVVILDARTANVLATEHPELARRRNAAPGSTVKPFVLRELLRLGRLRADEPIACRRKVRLNSHVFDCTHAIVPEPMTAETALAYSCNSYFTDVSTRLTSAELQNALRTAGFSGTQAARTREEQQLQALGEFGIKVSPRQMALAYQRLASGISSSARDEAVRDGLTAATEYGMARLASTKSRDIAGKTGTSRADEGSWTHGWFAGFAPARNPKFVVVVFLEQGQGRDAAAIAGNVFTALQQPSFARGPQ